MALTESLRYEGKRVPTEVAFRGEEMDLGAGEIEVQHALRTQDGSYMDPGNLGPFLIRDELTFVASDGTTGLQVMQYLAEWFEHKRSQ